MMPPDKDWHPVGDCMDINGFGDPVEELEPLMRRRMGGRRSMATVISAQDCAAIDALEGGAQGTAS